MRFGLPNSRDRDTGPALNVGIEHLLEIHAVDVVGANDDYIVGLLVTNEVQTLKDCIRGSCKPSFSQPLLSGYRRNIGVQHSAETPRLRHVSVERVRFVLGEDHNLAKSRVDQIGDCEVNQPIVTGERDSRLRPIFREWHESLALAPGENYSEHLVCRHVSSVVDGAPVTDGGVD